MVASIAITPEEHRARCDALLERLRAEELSGIVLFDPYYVLYYAGFAFAPTERPIAFVLAADGDASARRPSARGRARRGEGDVRPCRALPRVPRRSSLRGRARNGSVCARAVGGKIGADQDGYPWILGYRGPTLSRALGSNASSESRRRSRSRWRSSPRPRSQLIRESCRWGNLAHRLLQRYTRPGVTETEVAQRASNEATFAMLDAIGEIYRAPELLHERRARRLPRARSGATPRSRTPSPATSSSRPETCS